MTPKIILASASIGRQMLLRQLGVPFEVMVSGIEEDIITHQNPIKRLQMRARAKAEEIKARIQNQEYRILEKKKDSHNSVFIPHDSYIIVAADSEAILDGKTYGKVKNKAETKEMVRALMGKTHEFATATAIVYLRARSDLAGLQDPILNETKRWENVTTTRVTLRTMTESEIEQYTTRYDFTRFAAAYTLNETPWDWVTRIDGSYTNVIGLPFEVILPIFRKLKII